MRNGEKFWHMNFQKVTDSFERKFSVLEAHARLSRKYFPRDKYRLVQTSWIYLLMKLYTTLHHMFAHIKFINLLILNNDYSNK